MRTLDDKIVLIETEDEVKEDFISIIKESPLTYRIYSRNIDKEWSTYPYQRLQKIAKGFIKASERYCLIRGNIIDAIMLASVLRVNL